MPRVVVFHASYGCDTGCCGHVVEMDDTEEFVFAHPNFYGPDWERLEGKGLEKVQREFVKDLVTKAFGVEHVADIDWDEVMVLDD